ncbi:PRC-barrel domain containing protein [Streptacidiphilus sp. PAMC 29251]
MAHPEADRAEPGVVTGYTVHASDGKVGTVLRTDTTPGQAHLTVTTGPWFLGKQLVLPLGIIAAVDHEEQSVLLACTRAQAKDAPSYDSHDRDAFASYQERALTYFSGAEPADRFAP